MIFQVDLIVGIIAESNDPEMLCNKSHRWLLSMEVFRSPEILQSLLEKVLYIV